MTNTKPMLNSSRGDVGAPDRRAADQRSRDSRRMNRVAAWLLIFVTRLLMAVVGWHTVKLYYLWLTVQDWEPLGSPPGSAVAFFRGTEYVWSTDGKVYRAHGPGSWRAVAPIDTGFSRRHSGSLHSRGYSREGH